MKIDEQADYAGQVHHVQHEPRALPKDDLHGPVNVIRDPDVVHNILHRAGDNRAAWPAPINLGNGITVRPSSELELARHEDGEHGCMYREDEEDTRPAWARQMFPEGRRERCPGLCHWARRFFLGAED